MVRLLSAGVIPFAVSLLAVQTWLIVDAGDTVMALTLSSSAFNPGDKIPSKYTCEGDDVSPPLSFSGAPQGTKSYALILDDPDAPDPKAPKRVWVHWVVYNLPANTTDLAENASATGLPKGAVTRSTIRNRPLTTVRVLPPDGTATSISSTRSTRRSRPSRSPRLRSKALRKVTCSHRPN